MKILQSGMMKAGNYWLYSILQGIISEAGIENRSFILNDPIQAAAKTWQLSFAEQHRVDYLDFNERLYRYRIGNIFKMPVDDLDAYLEACTHVWTHSPANELSVALFPKFDKIIHIIRDPRDSTLSFSRYVFSAYRKKYMPTRHANPEAHFDAILESQSAEWQAHVASYLAVRKDYNIYPIFYERMIANIDEEVKGLLAYLEIDLDEAAQARIIRATSFETMRQVSPNHLNKGQSYKWMEQVSAAQTQRILEQAAGLLTALNYPLTANDAPSLPNLDKAQPETMAALLKKSQKKPFIKRAMRRVLRLLS